MLGNLTTSVRLSSTRLADFSSSGQLSQILHKADADRVKRAFDDADD